MSKTAVIYLRVSTAKQVARDGSEEGFSIPAQREACRRKAEALGATVVEEYLDAGESARSADRDQLQRLLATIARPDHGIDYLVVHKVDRLARNRADDVTIGLALKAAGITLVSATENIDDTPSGKLLHGIMASIAEFYSANLATEVIKGSVKKAQAGGTPGKAPLGYLNVRRRVDGREIRTVEIDPDRGPLIAHAFETYARGDVALTDLTAELNELGLTNPATARWPQRPVVRSMVGRILKNRYYLGSARGSVDGGIGHAVVV